MNTELEDRIRTAVSRLNRSRSEYAGGWHLYTLNDMDLAVGRIEQLMEETRESAIELERVYVDLLALTRLTARGD